MHLNKGSIMKIGLCLVLLIAASAPWADELRDIELRRLFQPTPDELQAERSGRIYIYDGLWDRDIERAMDEEYDRVESMMFIRVKVTQREGEEDKDVDTGVAYVQDDGC